ncbi:hypothetical protein EV666_106162 [Camelimonas lactis]|uniref:Uncharacterized protein n=1 Tax=Camelimonas lactis TaxID=659006 RepID=A0A4R2GTA4_9HYPH|nr:hypothetical protein EV666_106162 [Camelimonas lactis]
MALSQPARRVLALWFAAMTRPAVPNIVEDWAVTGRIPNAAVDP